MSKRHAVAVLFGLASILAAQSAPPVAGHWEGVLIFQGAETAAALDVQSDQTGLHGTIDVPALILLRFPLASIQFRNESIHFEEREQNAKFDGTLERGRLTGTFTGFGGMAGEFQLNRVPSYTPPYSEEEVRFANGNVNLSGTLIRPRTPGPYPAVLCTHGSGPVTRNSARYLAERFARSGIATLIYDKRGVGGSSPDMDWRRSSFFELAGDAAAGIAYLKKRADIQPKRIGMYGHSQGGWIEALAASKTKDIAFLIFSSGSAVSARYQETYRVEHELRKAGFPEGDIAEALNFMKLKFAVARTGEGWGELQNIVEKARDQKWLPYTNPPRSLETLREHWRGQFSYDPESDWEQIHCPVLAVFGGRETSVPYKTTIEVLQRALRKAGNEKLTVKVFPDVDHGLFVSARKGEKWFWPHLLPEYLDTITQWLTAPH